MRDGRILVLGATGTVGSMVVDELASEGAAVRAASRRGAGGQPKAASAGQRGGEGGVEWVRFDYEEPGSFEGAVAGVESVFMVVRPGDDRPQDTAVPLLDAALKAGVKKVVLLSAMGAELRPDFGLRVVELAIEARGFRFVHLRPNWFMQLFTSGPFHADLMATSSLHLPAADAAISYIDARDIAQVAARVLMETEFEGRGYTLTGPEALRHEDMVSVLARAVGRSLRYVPLTEEQARAGLAAAGFPANRVERLIGFYRLVRQGLCAPVSDATERILGRPARGWLGFVEENPGVFVNGRCNS